MANTADFLNCFLNGSPCIPDSYQDASVFIFQWLAHSIKKGKMNVIESKRNWEYPMLNLGLKIRILILVFCVLYPKGCKLAKFNDFIPDVV